VGSGPLVEEFKLSYAAPANSLSIGSTGIVSVNHLRLSNGLFHTSADGKERIYCFANGGTVIQGHGTIPLSYKIGNGTTVVQISDAGKFAIGVGGSAVYKLHVKVNYDDYYLFSFRRGW